MISRRQIWISWKDATGTLRGRKHVASVHHEQARRSISRLRSIGCLILALAAGHLAVGYLRAEEQETLTLVEAVRLAVGRHPDVQKARAAVDILKGKIREVRAQALPDIAVEGSFIRLRDPSLLNASG